MKLSKKAISLLLVLSIVISLIVPIELTTNADTVPPVGVKFNLRAVNLLSGEEILTATSTLTIQYTDATLGDNIKMYATIKNGNTTVLDSAEVTEANLKVIDGVTIYGANEEVGKTGRDACSKYLLCRNGDVKEGNAGTVTLVKNNIQSNAAGSVSFVPGAAVSGLNVANLQITVWTKDTSSGVCSSMATTIINNNFMGYGTEVPNGLTTSNWMNYIDGSTLLSQINMPGTHDSGTTYIGTPTANQCQNLTIAEQLELGARYLDIRAYNGKAIETKENVVDDKDITTFFISHSNFVAYKTSDTSSGNELSFYDVYLQMKAFLEANPSETIVMALSDDGTGSSATREEMLQSVASIVALDPSLWYTKGTEIPTLDDVRGKIVYVRRIVNNHTRTDQTGMDFFWINGENDTVAYPHAMFPKSQATAATIATTTGSEKHVISSYNYNIYTTTVNPDLPAVTTYYVQDSYKVDMETKWTRITDTLKKAVNEKEANQYYLNFFSSAYATTPSAHAQTLNTKFVNDVSLTKGEQYGYLLFDFINGNGNNTNYGSSICEKVYKSNIFLKEPQLTIVNGKVTSDKNDKKVVHYTFEKIENNTVENVEHNGFDGNLVNTSLISHNSIYDLITLNNSGKNYPDAGYVNIQQGVFAGSSETATIQVWMKATANTSATTLFGMGSYNVMAGITHFGSQTARFAMGTQKGLYEGRNDSGLITSEEAWNLNEWQLFTYVLENGTLKIYKNKTLMTEGSLYANFSDINGGIAFDDSFCLGAAAYSGWPDPGFTGSLGDFSIYNYAVSENEIETMYNSLAKEYTYILEATLANGETAIASETISGTCIDENYYNGRSKIYFDVPSDYDITNAKLSLEIDGTNVLISENGGDYKVFDSNTAYDLSNAVLKVISLNGEDYSKEYEIAVNGVIVKDYSTTNFVKVLPTNTTITFPEVENSLCLWYNSSNTSTSEITTASAGDVVYLKQIAIGTPGINPNESKGIRIAEDNTNGLRFKTTITRDDFYNYFNEAGVEYVYSEESTFKFGILLMPEDILTNRELTATDLTRENVPDAVSVVAKKIYEQGLNDNGLDYTAVILNIPETQYTRNFVARAYIEYTYNNNTEIIYSDEVSVGSYLSVAQAAYAGAVKENDTETQNKLLSVFTKEQLTTE